MADAMTQAIDCLEAAIFFRLKNGEAIPDPSPRKKGPEGADMVAVQVQPLMAAKIAVLEAFRDSGTTRVALAEKLGLAESEVRRILDPAKATKINRIDDALRAMGKRLAIVVEAA